MTAADGRSPGAFIVANTSFAEAKPALEMLAGDPASKPKMLVTDNMPVNALLLLSIFTTIIGAAAALSASDATLALGLCVDPYHWINRITRTWHIVCCFFTTSSSKIKDGVYALDQHTIERIKGDFTSGTLPVKLVGKDLQLMKEGPPIKVIQHSDGRVGFFSGGGWAPFTSTQVDKFFDPQCGNALVFFKDNVPRRIRPWTEIEAAIKALRSWGNGETDEDGNVLAAKERPASPTAGACEARCPKCGEEFLAETEEREVVMSHSLLVDNNKTPLHSVLSGRAYENALKSGVYLRSAVDVGVEKEQLGSNGYAEYHKAGTTSGTENRHGQAQRMIPSATMGMESADDYNFEVHTRLNSDIEWRRCSDVYNPGHYNPEMIAESTLLALLVGDESEQPRFVEPAPAPDHYLLFGEYFKAMNPELFDDGGDYARRLLPENYIERPQSAAELLLSAPSAPSARSSSAFNGQLGQATRGLGEEEIVEIIMREFRIPNYQLALVEIARCKPSSLKNNREACNSGCVKHQEESKQAKIAAEKDPFKQEEMRNSKSRRPWGGHIKGCPHGTLLALRKRWKELQDDTVRKSNHEPEQPHQHLRTFFDGGGPRPDCAIKTTNPRKRPASRSP